MRLLLDQFETPVGLLSLVSDGRALIALELGEVDHRLHPMLAKRFKGETVELVDVDDPQGFSSALRAYFDGRFDAIDCLPANGGGTDFQRRVWAALREIPRGTTESYGKLARKIGTPNGMRAVGLANGANPISIVVPCHRVIGADGSMTGFGGGIERKKWLLTHEQAMPGGDQGLLPL